MLFCSTHRPATDYGDLPLDGFSQTLERDDMSWFYNEYSDVVLTRTSIRLLLNQRPRAQSSTRERMNQSCEPPGFGGEGRIVYLPMKTGGRSGKLQNQQRKPAPEPPINILAQFPLMRLLDNDANRVRF